MFFEDEKEDILGNGADIHISEDGTVTWEDVLSDDGDDDLLSLSESTNKPEKPQKAVETEDELQFVENDDDVDDTQLNNILNESTAQEPPKQKAFEAFGNQEETPEEDFDIDSQLANVVMEQNNSGSQDDIIQPRRSEPKKQQSSSLMPILLALLIACLVVGGVYYFMNNFSNDNGTAEDALAPAPSVQQDLNNTTAEDIAQRQEEQAVKQEETAKAEEQPQEEEKAEEPAQPEKKKVVNVIPTGRPNPFLPIQKYIAVKIPDTVIQYDKTGIPMPPASYGEQDEGTTKLLTIAVSGIMYDNQKPSAIITLDGNDYFVQKGDRLDNYRVVDIGKNSVMIALGKNIYRANIGEQFNINSKISGSAQFIPQKQGGGRQYYTSTEETQDSANSTGARYVSENDVVIKSK